MSIVFVAGVWFVLGMVVCFLSGRGIAEGGQAPDRPAVRPAAPRRFAALPVSAWTLAAERVALDELLTDPSDLIGRVTAE